MLLISQSATELITKAHTTMTPMIDATTSHGVVGICTPNKCVIGLLLIIGRARLGPGLPPKDRNMKTLTRTRHIKRKSCAITHSCFIVKSLYMGKSCKFGTLGLVLFH